MKAIVLGAAAIVAAAQPALAHPESAHRPVAHLAKHKATGSEADTAAIKSVLAQYQTAIERLDARGTERLFTADSLIFETGGAEGTYANYLSHHLGPELGEFKSFKFSDYKIDVRLLGSAAALATESYTYRIETKKGEVAERLGVATSVLTKENGQWKVLMMHNSGRRPRAS